MSISDANFVYYMVSDLDKTIGIAGLNSNYSTSSTNWGVFPAIPSVYAGSDNNYNGNGNVANAYKVVEIRDNAFDSKTAFSETTLTPTFLPSNLKRIGERAFSGVKFKGTLTIPATIESVGHRAFYNCTLITDVTIGSSTNSDIITHLANLTATIDQEITDRKAAYDQLNLLKAPIDNATFTGNATISNASIGVATMTSASIATANIASANITSASITTVNVVGNAAFGGAASTTGQWNFTVQPKYETNVIATESYVNTKISNIAGGSLSTALDTLSELASAVGNNPSFATNIINAHISLSNTLSTEVVARSTAASTLSSLLSTSASSLSVVDSTLSTTLSTEISTRSTSASSISSALNSASSSLTAVDTVLSTALVNEIGTRTTSATSISSALVASAASLTAVDTVLNTALNTEISARTSAVVSVAPLITGSLAALTTSDGGLSSALSTETSTRTSAMASTNALQSTSLFALSGTDSTLNTTLSTEINARSSAVLSISGSASGAITSLQMTNVVFSIALATEVGARSMSMSSLSTSTSGSVSTMTSTNSSISTALGTEVAARISTIASASTLIVNTASPITTSNTAQSNTLTTETTVRSSQFVSIASTVSVSVASLSVANAAVSTALVAETANRSNAISIAIINILSGAPSRMNTLSKIVAELQTNNSVVITTSTISRVSTLSSAVSAENSTRISAIASVSNSAIASLAAVDTGMSTSLSAETSNRGVAVASLSSALSSASASFVGVDGVLSSALSTEINNRSTSIVSLSTAILTSNASLTSVNSTLSLALSNEIVNRQSAIGALATTMSTSILSLTGVNSVLSMTLSNEASTRVASIASVSAGIVASITALQSVNATLNTSISILSGALSLKATTSYLDTQISNLLNGAPNNLNTLGELAAALNNNPSYASSITSVLSTKVDNALVVALSTTVAGKANATDLTALETVVSNKADTATINTVNASVTTMNNTATTLLSLVSTLKATGGTINANTIAVGGVTITDLTNRVQELYYNLGTANPSWGIVNPDGTINHKLNRLANPSLVSNRLGFEYDANDNVTKVMHLVTVLFDKNQTSATKTGGAGNPTVTVNNMALDVNGNYTFTFPYIGDVYYYTMNKTSVSMTALDSQYKLAPASPTISLSSLNIYTLNQYAPAGSPSSYPGTVWNYLYKHIPPTVSTPYAATAWDNAAQLITQTITVSTQDANLTLKFNLGVYTTSNITISAVNGATLVAGQTNQFAVSGTSATFNVRYAPSLVGTGDGKLYVGVMGTSSKIPSELLTLSGVVNAGPTYAAPTVSTPYAATTWDNAAQLITHPITVAAQEANTVFQFTLGTYLPANIAIEAINGAAVVAGQTNQFTVSGTSATFNVRYAPSLVATGDGKIYVNLVSSSTKFSSSSLSISGAIAGGPTHATPTVSTPYAATTWNPTTQMITQPITVVAQDSNTVFQFSLGTYLPANMTIEAASGAVVIGQTNQFTVSGTSATFNVKYLRSLFGTGDNKIYVNILTSSTKLLSGVLMISGVINDIQQYAVPVQNSKVISSTMTSLFSLTSPTNRSTVTNFPNLNAFSSWDMSIYFNATTISGWRGLIGSIYYSLTATGRDWGCWINPSGQIVWGWQAGDIVSTATVSAGVNYYLKLTKTSTTMKFDLTNISTGIVQTQTLSHANPAIGTSGPVSVGGWIATSSEAFSGTISAIYVGSLNHTANYTTASTAGVNVYNSANTFTNTVTTPGAGTFAVSSQLYDVSKVGSVLLKVSAASDVSKRESAMISVSAEDIQTYQTPTLSGSVAYNGTTATATYTLATNISKVSVFSKSTGPIVTGIAMQYVTVGTGVSQSGNWYGNWTYQVSGVHNAHYRLRFSNGVVSNLTIFSDSDRWGGLTTPDVSFAVSNVPASGVTAILQGRNNAFTGDVWYDVDIDPQAITSSTTTLKFGGRTHLFSSTPAVISGDTAIISSATVSTPGTIALSIPYTSADVSAAKSFYVVANADIYGKASSASTLQLLRNS